MSTFLHRAHLVFPSFVGLTSLTRVLQTAVTGSSITIPNGVQAGDLIVYAGWGDGGSSAPTWNNPSGFTTIYNQNSGIQSFGNYTLVVACKISNGTEGGDSFTTITGSARNSMIFVLRGNVPLVSFGSATDVDFFAGATNPSSQTVTSSGGTPPLIVFGLYGSDGTAVSPRTMSPAQDDEYNATSSWYVAWKVYYDTPANVSVDMADEGNGNTLGSFYLPLTI